MNENPEGLPLDFFDKVMEGITPDYVAMYPEMTSLIEMLSSYLRCEPSNICLTNGSDDAIRLMFEVFGEPGKKVVSVTPSFEMYSVYMKMYGMIHSPIPFDDSFNVQSIDVLNSIDSDTSIVILLNPNSPIGATWTESEMITIIKKAQENHAIVVIDEAYYYFSSNTFINYMREYDNVIVFRTFSKMLSIAGARIGYVVSNEKRIAEFKKACSTYPVNSFAIRFAEKILEHPQIIDDLTVKERQGREYLLGQLEKYKYEYHFNQGNYVLIKSNKEPSFLFEELKKKRVLIKTYQAPLLDKWIRITTGSKEIMQIFWKHFIEVDRK